jgi:uncharacterized protein (DUF433 family)
MKTAILAWPDREHMPIDSDDEILGGDPRIEGTRIGVLHVAELVLVGYPVEDVADQYETSPADAYERWRTTIATPRR